MRWDLVKKVLMYVAPAAAAGAVGYAVYRMVAKKPPARAPLPAKVEVVKKPPEVAVEKPPEKKPPEAPTPRGGVEVRRPSEEEVRRKLEEEGIPSEVASEVAKVRVATRGGARLSRYQAWVLSVHGSLSEQLKLIEKCMMEGNKALAERYYKGLKSTAEDLARYIERQYREGLLSGSEYNKLIDIINKMTERAEELLQKSPEEARKEVKERRSRRVFRKVEREERVEKKEEKVKPAPKLGRILIKSDKPATFRVVGKVTRVGTGWSLSFWVPPGDYTIYGWYGTWGGTLKQSKKVTVEAGKVATVTFKWGEAKPRSHYPPGYKTVSVGRGRVVL